MDRPGEFRWVTARRRAVTFRPPTAPPSLRTDCGAADHEWVRCRSCPTDGPCACAGGICCQREADAIAEQMHDD